MACRLDNIVGDLHRELKHLLLLQDLVFEPLALACEILPVESVQFDQLLNVCELPLQVVLNLLEF